MYGTARPQMMKPIKAVQLQNFSNEFTDKGQIYHYN